MQNRFALLLGSLLMAVIFVGAGCSSNTTTTTNATVTTNAAETEDSAGVDAEEEGSTSLGMPAPGFEDVDEMQVNTNGSVETETSTDSEDESDTQTHVVSTTGNSFTPSTLTISAGDSVQFEMSATHNVVEVTQANWEAKKAAQKDDGFTVDFGGTELITFDTPGTYYYVCEPHVAMGMVGMIVVE